MAISTNIKSLQDIMRQDPGVSGDLQYMQQFSWLLFLKMFDTKEREWEYMEDSYIPVLESKYQWRNWAEEKRNSEGKITSETLTGDDLIDFTEELFAKIKEIEISNQSDTRHVIFVTAMKDVANYMKKGTLLREVLNQLNKINFGKKDDIHEFGDYYETFLKGLQSASGNSGEFYTPRPITDFMAEMTCPKLGDRIADFACGTGGFLISALNKLPKIENTGDLHSFDNALYGIEKKPLPYILACLNMLVHDLTNPNIILGNTLETSYKEHRQQEKFDIILMNPPFGGTEEQQIQDNFPADYKSGETFDLFLYVIMERLKKGGKCGLILPDGFFFGDGVKQRLKEKLFSEFNVHTIIRLPNDVFAPYTNITTNILFFDNTGKTEETWFYRMDKPEGYKHFSKTKPLLAEHLDVLRNWWNNREEIITDDKPKAKKYTFEEIKERNYNIDLCPYPQEEKEILNPFTLIENYRKVKQIIDYKIDSSLNGIISELQGKSIKENNEKAVIDSLVCECNNNHINIVETDIKTLEKDLKESIIQHAIQGRLTEKYRKNSQCTMHNDQSPVGFADTPFSEGVNPKTESTESDPLCVQPVGGQQKNSPILVRGVADRRSDGGCLNDNEYTNDTLPDGSSAPFPIPASWQWKKLGDIVNNFDSKRVPIAREKRNLHKKLYNYYGATGIIDKVDNYIFDGEYLMIGEDGGNFYTDKENAFVCNGKFWANNHVHVLQSKKDLNKYIKYVIDSLNLPAINLITGIAVPKLNQKNMNKIPIPLPPLEEQKEIVSQIEKYFAIIEKLSLSD